MNIVDIIDIEIRNRNGVYPTPQQILMSPDDLAELREYLQVELEDDLIKYRGLKIIIEEDLDDIRLL